MRTQILIVSDAPIQISERFQASTQIVSARLTGRLDITTLREHHLCTPFRKAVVVGHDARAPAIARQIERALHVEVEAVAAWTDDLLEGSLAPAGGAHYRSADEWLASAVDDIPFYRRELDAVTRLLDGRRFRRALDVGAGYGRVARQLGVLASQVVMLEASAPMLAQARALGVRVPAVRATVDAVWPLASHTFDLVVGLQILNHAYSLRHFFAELARVMTPGGEAVLSVGNSDSLRQLTSPRKPRYHEEGFRRLPVAWLVDRLRDAGWNVTLVGGTGLLSPWPRLARLRSFDNVPALWPYSHLVVLHLQVGRGPQQDTTGGHDPAAPHSGRRLASPP